MADFIDIPAGDARSVRSKRRAVKILMIGQPEDVAAEIAHLYHCGYGRVENWSRALPYAQIQQATVREPGEIMRIYKRYVDR
jgi:alkanesulfonate monooxygenase SsuD/methylene tetrahydromethanopterin reductase-like flavin-dependent oxidoreductase (luciferase family)